MNATEQQTAPVLRQLMSEDSEEVREAAFEAGELRLVSAVDLLAGHIQSENLGIQEAAEFALRRIRGAAAVAAVAPLLRSDNASVRNSAMDILREIGADDMKALNLLLHDDDPDIRIFAADILGTSGKTLAVSMLSETLLHDEEVNVRYQAGISLGELGFAEAAEALSKALKDEEWVQFAAIEALAKIKADSCAAILVNALPEASELVASTLINALGEMGNVKAVPILLKRLDLSGGPLRNKTVKAIVQILGAPSLELLAPKEQDKLRSYLLIALEDEDEDILEAALVGLSGIGGEEGTRAVLGLVSRLDPERAHDLLVGALKCLVAIGFNAALEEGLTSPDERTRYTAVEACGHIGDRASAQALKNAFEQLNRDMQRTAAHYLARQESEEDTAFFLDVLARNTDSHVIKGAVSFLGAVRCLEAAPRLLELLEHQYDDVKETALEACLALRDPGVNARLTGLFQSPEPLKRLMAVYSMGKIGVTEYLDDLAEALEDEIPDIRKTALEAVGEAYHGESELLDMISPRINDENREVRLALVEILSAADDAQTVRLLVQALEDEDDWVCIRAVEALGGRKLPEVVPQLVQMLDTGNLLVMLKIIEALGAVGGQAAFRALLALAGHDDPDVQQAVADALARIREEQGEEN